MRNNAPHPHQVLPQGRSDLITKASVISRPTVDITVKASPGSITESVACISELNHLDPRWTNATGETRPSSLQTDST